MTTIEQDLNYTLPIAKRGEQQFACIVRNISGSCAREIHFGARFINGLSDADKQAAVDAVYALYEKWCGETGKKARRDSR